MKLTKRTIPQVRDYQCDKCKVIKCHKDMYDDSYCYDCYDEIQTLGKEFSIEQKPEDRDE